MYQIIVSDLDGTLLSPNHCITTFTRTTLQILVSKGIHFVFATGRHYIDVDKIRDKLGIPAYMITSNGARVYNSNDELIFSYNLDADIASELYGIKYNDRNILTHIYREKEWFINRSYLEESNEFWKSTIIHKVYQPDILPTDSVSKIFFTCDDPNYLLPLEKNIESRWGTRVHATFSSPTCLEIMAGGISKGYVLKDVVKELGYSLSSCIAFGDGMNDLEMLKMVGKGYIMSNAHQRLKDILPKLEIIGSNAEDAVPHTLHKIFF